MLIWAVVMTQSFDAQYQEGGNLGASQDREGQDVLKKSLISRTFVHQSDNKVLAVPGMCHEKPVRRAVSSKKLRALLQTCGGDRENGSARSTRDSFTNGAWMLAAYCRLREPCVCLARTGPANYV